MPDPIFLSTLRSRCEGGGGGGGWFDYVIKILIFSNFRNINWTIFVNYVIEIFIFYQFYTRMSLPNIVNKLIIVLRLYTLNLALLVKNLNYLQ